MHCPKCGTKLYCPCKLCIDRRPILRHTYNDPLWADMGAGIIRCEICRFEMPIDMWANISNAIYQGKKKEAEEWKVKLDADDARESDDEKEESGDGG